MPNSNTSNILLVPRLRTTNLLHANTNTGEGLLCYHKSLTQWKKLITITLYAFFFSVLKLVYLVQSVYHNESNELFHWKKLITIT